MDPDCKLSQCNTGMSNSAVYCCTAPLPQTTTAHSVHCLPCLSCIICMLHECTTVTLYYSFTSVPSRCGMHWDTTSCFMGDQRVTSFSRIFSFLTYSMGEKQKRKTESEQRIFNTAWINKFSFTVSSDKILCLVCWQNCGNSAGIQSLCYIEALTAHSCQTEPPKNRD